ncbi:MAG: hypothetical protein LLG00_08770 [Planctomycetaceae bacterium]|nr:hypothetical protein [Planctomycetaceae bacterium]
MLSSEKGAAIVVTYDWDKGATRGIHPSTFSLEGQLFRGKSGDPPSPGVRGCNREVDGKRYDGLEVYDAKDGESLIGEVLVHGEKGRVLMRVKSKVAIAVKVTNPGMKGVAWVELGRQKNGPIDLSPGEHKIEIVEKQ